MEMRFKAFLLTLALVTSPLQATAQNAQPTNEFGAPVGLNHATGINYGKQELESAEKTLKSAARQQKMSAEVNTLSSTDEISLSPIWGLYQTGAGIGASGFYAADLDEDGKTELIFGSGYGYGANTKISILTRASSTYRISHQFNAPSGATINSIAGFHDIAADNQLLFAATRDEILVYNLSVRLLIGSIPITNANLLLLQDVDNDQKAELIVVSSYATYAINPHTLEIKYTYNIGAPNAIFGYFTAINQLSIALNTGKVYNINGSELELVWDYPQGFGQHLAITDADQDGIDELIGAAAWHDLKAFDVLNQFVKWSHSSNLNINSLRTFDVDNDGIKEILYGDGQWGGVHALNPATGTTLWSVNNPEHGVTDILVTDIDDDGQLELLWGAGHTSSGPDYLYIHDLVTHEKEWQSSDIGGPFRAYQFADVDNDGKEDIIVISHDSESGYRDGILYVFDASDFTLKWSTAGNSPFDNQAWTGIHDVAVADVDGDGKNEIIVGTDRLYNGAIYVLDGTTGEVKYSKILHSGSPVYSVTTIDIDKDGADEIIVGGGRAHTGSPGTFIFVLDGKSGDILKTSPSLSNFWANLQHMEVIDINVDGHPDVVALLDGDIYIYDISNNRLTNTEAKNLSALGYGLVDGIMQIISSRDGSLFAYDANFNETSLGQACTSPIAAISRFTNSQILFTCTKEMGLYDLLNHQVAWSYQTTETLWKMRNSLAPDNIRLLAGADGIYVFEIPAAPTDLITHNQALTTQIRTPLTGELSAEGNTDELLFYIIEAPAHGNVTFTDRSAGKFQYTPNGKYVGQDSFTFVAISNGQESNTAEIIITLTNNAPISTAQNFSTHWRTPLTANLIATDADLDYLQYAIVNNPVRGELSLDNQSGIFVFTPQGNNMDTVTFTFNVSDGYATTAATTATITFTNNKPGATNLSFNTYYSNSINALLSGVDADGDELTYQLISSPSQGTLTIDAQTGLFTYNPAGEASYETSFQYQVNDGITDSDVNTVTISVTGKNTTNGSSKSGGGSVSFLFLAALLTAGLLHASRNSRNQR